MKTLLTVFIGFMILVILCDVEENSTKTILNYTKSFTVLPFLSLALYARTHLEEFKKFIQ